MSQHCTFSAYKHPLRSKFIERIWIALHRWERVFLYARVFCTVGTTLKWLINGFSKQNPLMSDKFRTNERNEKLNIRYVFHIVCANVYQCLPFCGLANYAERTSFNNEYLSGVWAWLIQLIIEDQCKTKQTGATQYSHLNACNVSTIQANKSYRWKNDWMFTLQLALNWTRRSRQSGWKVGQRDE